MNKIIKGFQQFVNEGQGPAHQLYRKADDMRKQRDYSNPRDWSDKITQIATDYKTLKTDDPAEADRFAELAKRLAGHSYRTGRKELIKRVDPKLLARMIADNFADSTDTWPTELSHEFLNGDMSIDQLKREMIKRSGIQNLETGEFRAKQVIGSAISRGYDLARKMVNEAKALRSELVGGKGQKAEYDKLSSAAQKELEEDFQELKKLDASVAKWFIGKLSSYNSISAVKSGLRNAIKEVNGENPKPDYPQWDFRK
jgi:hypothetical protein